MRTFDQHDACLLSALGFVCERYPASWEDVGGPENGPKLIGGPAYQIWEKDDWQITVCEGVVVDYGEDYFPGGIPF